MISFFYKFHSAIKKHAEFSAPFMIPFGIFGTLNYPIFYFYWKIHGSVSYDDIVLRSIATFLCLLLACKDLWSVYLKSFLPIFWYGAVTFCIPFMAIYIFLEVPNSPSWELNIILGLFWLIILLDWVSFSIVLPLGVFMAFLVHFIQGKEFIFPPNIFSNLTNICWVIITAFVFLRRKEVIQEAKRQSLKMQAGAIAHEMRTPLSAIDTMAGGLKLHLPTLLHTQEVAQEKDKSIPYLYKETLQALSEVPNELKEVARSTFIVIDMMLMNLKEDVTDAASEKCFIIQSIETALHEYALTEEDKNIISLNSSYDFEFQGNHLMIKHVLFNLIKNSLYYVKAANKGKISIWTEPDGKFNKLYFEDTGKGISKEHLPHVFDQFFTRTAYGTGVGLAFCKMVMTRLGGNITCDSVEGKYTRFTLSFPALKKNDIS